jgi:hypothetical protein
VAGLPRARTSVGHLMLAVGFLAIGSSDGGVAQEFADVRWFRNSDVPLHRSDPHLARFLAKLSSNN